MRAQRANARQRRYRVLGNPVELRRIARVNARQEQAELAAAAIAAHMLIPAGGQVAPSEASTHVSDVLSELGSIDREEVAVQTDAPIIPVAEAPRRALLPPFPLTRDVYPRQHWAGPSNKLKVYTRGAKQALPTNVLPDKEVDNQPLFVVEQKSLEHAQKLQAASACQRELVDKLFQSDIDLVYHLKLEAAFVPRTTQLLVQLKHRARKWMAQWDCSHYTSKEQYQIMMAAIGQAMCIDQWEENIRTLMRQRPEAEIRRKHNSFLDLGRPGASSGTCLTSHRKKESVFKRYLRRPLTHAIVY